MVVPSPLLTTASTIPRRNRYENGGDREKFQVRMPFRTATVLVTVEREGVLH